MIRSLFLAAAAVLLLGAAPAEKPVVDPSRAGPSLAGPSPIKLSGYLSAAAIDGQAVIGPPPALDSPRGRADRTVYLETRAMAGSARWIQATKDNDLWNGGALERYACALGAPIDAKASPATYHLLQRVELDARTVGTPPKDHYNRTRPPIGDEQPICIKREDWMKTNASYPSGHAMVGMAWGLILGELAPARASGLALAGREIGDSRVICGVHYQSDVEAGRLLGSVMVAREHADPAFRADFAAAQAELAKTRLGPANCPTP
ncbi:phosphatase PAP2 family protein [Phenylobacterium sp.]|uniref:acid phosphatase n=1 Tax=Phenylobacterium sp. TaxID=1871053 RepID=UPI001224A59B|nr:phosphatase PAP2 family protein [Phenylobacterium sp.]THD62778.1 MAG: phosphatase PAP2 family protein [Phenylobacterium sp.]